MTQVSRRLQAIERETVLKWLVVLVSVSIAINTVSIVGWLVERNVRGDADRASVEDRDELRARARIVECLIVGVLDPLVERNEAAGGTVSPDLKRSLAALREPASVRDANIKPCQPFVEPNP